MCGSLQSRTTPGEMTSRFEEYCRRKTEAAAAARIAGFASVVDPPGAPPGMVALGNEWSRQHFDGCFYRTQPEHAQPLPALSLVFVQSADGNTGAEDPSTLGGGETDKHLVYEGLSRVDADAVLAGATTAADNDVMFSIWRPELVRLRIDRGHSRHPAQVVLTDRGDLPVHTALLYNEPSLRVIVVASSTGAVVLQRRLPGRPWVEVIDAGQPVDLARAFRELYSRGLTVISAIGGRRTADALLRARLVAELYLTTSARPGGEPGTPLATGPLPPHHLLLEKEGRGEERGVRFQHLAFER
jgi:riboflavin biosynthesis pyrimidine reductase